jgi:hypothetical protein
MQEAVAGQQKDLQVVIRFLKKAAQEAVGMVLMMWPHLLADRYLPQEVRTREAVVVADIHQDLMVGLLVDQAL